LAADSGGNLIVRAYADTVTNSYGGSPVQVATNVTVFYEVEDEFNTIWNGSATITTNTTNSGSSSSVDPGPDVAILNVQIISISPSNFGNQTYSASGGQLSSTCN
jgi:hypothetical protein